MAGRSGVAVGGGMTDLGAANALRAALLADPLGQACGADRIVVLGRDQQSWADAPVVMWEEGPYEWAVAVTGSLGESLDESYSGGLGPGVAETLKRVREDGWFFEPVTSWMLGVYRA